MARDLPSNITRTKYGYHVRVVINGEYHAEHFVEADYDKGEAFELAKKKRKELVAKKEREQKPKGEYETRFLYENPDNSTGIIGVFFKLSVERTGKRYPYFCTTIIPEKGKPKSYSRSIEKWGKSEALLQICVIRKRHLLTTYKDRFDEERFDQSVINYMEENYLSYRDQAKERLAACESLE